MSRAAAILFVSGGALCIAALILPGSEVTNRAIFWGLAALALAAGLLLYRLGERTPLWAYQLLLPFGSLLVTASVAFTEDVRTDGGVLYLWPSMFAFYFFRRGVLIAQVAFIGVAYAAALAYEGGGSGQVTRWLTTMVTLAVVGVLIRLLKRRVNLLIERLAAAARTDVLTGALNRRGFEDLIDTELERSRRSGRPLSLIAGDLDHFKSVNDSFGHAGGDRALRRAAEVLKTSKRRIDTLARIGGEEFAILLPETDEHGAYVMAERLRDAIAEEFKERPEALTMSFGVSTFPIHRPDSEGLLAVADQALYAAKKLGRNRTVIYSAEINGILEGSAIQAPDPDVHLATLVTLAEALDIRDSGTAKHSQTVGGLAAMMAADLGFDPDHVERVRMAGVLHDIGKIAVSDTILRKPGRLTEEEWAEIKRHPETGARLLGYASGDIRRWVLCHHERPDGQGYPQGLRGSQVPVESRILSVADAYEAMTAERPYSAPKSTEIALAELRRCAGTQFDAEIVEIFIAGLDRLAAEV
jgi:diguanylate cyclase (GGDEF)-like protein/putative nucleotidyltransferase with HDIG domain